MLRHPIRELFSYCSRLNLLSLLHNFELAAKQTGSHATLSYV